MNSASHLIYPYVLYEAKSELVYPEPVEWILARKNHHLL